MAYDNQGAAVGAAGHYASAITAAFITAGAVTTTQEALEIFGEVLDATFAQCEALKGTLPEQAAPAKAYGGGKSYPKKSSGGGDNADPGTLEIRGGKYAGKTIAAVYEDDPSYLDWCVTNLKNDFLVGRIEAFLATV